MQSRDAILTLLAGRGPEKTICPSEAARLAFGADWRAGMGDVRAAAADLEHEGRLVVTQKGVRVDPAEAKGPVRYGRGGSFR